jgi:uncharacterized membrane protein YhhN
MERRFALARLVLVASVIAGVSFIVSWNMPLADAASTVWKGTGVALLALYAALRAKGTDGWLICAVMALGALGDVLLETHGLTTGAVAFLAGHLVALVLYLRNRRGGLTRSQRLLVVLLVPATVIIAYLLPADRAMAPGVALYAFGLSLMAATAWASRFPRFVVGAGALMFLISDLLIFARAGPLADTFLVGLAVWGLYYFGQFLICVGVTAGLAKARRP